MRRAPADAEPPPVEALSAGLRLALATGDATRDRDALSRVADWRAVADLATRHRVVALLLRAVRSCDVPMLDAVVERDLARQRRQGVRRGMRQLAAMRRTTAGLAERGIPALVLKGLPLGQRVYGSPFAKSSVDVDLLVPPDAFAAAGRALRDLGWRRTLPAETDSPARLRWADRVLNQHVFTGCGAKVELHRSLFGNTFLFDPPFAALEANAATVEIAGETFRTPGDADQLLYLACHGSLHGWERLKWVCDFAMLVRSMGDDAAGRAVARALRQGLAGAVGPALLLCREALHVETTATAGALQRRRRIRLVADLSRYTWTRRPELRHTIARKAAIRAGRFLVGRGIRFNLYEMRRLLVRPADFDRIASLPDRLFWLYVPLRPVLWLLRLLRREA